MHEDCLRPTPLIDSDHPRIVEFARDAAAGATDGVDVACRVYLAVRDGLRYDPYGIELTEDGMRASAVLASGRGWCVAKAGVLAACSRSLGIPARLGFADVRNHLATERLLAQMGTDIFYWHGFTELFLEGRWVKATPAFNLQMCERFGVLPLEFNGRDDSVFHPFDATGRRHMEYVRDRGSRDDMPLEEIRRGLAECYPAMAGGVPRGDFDSEK